ncbi:hypothetical protein [Catellatospora bangladeshensis]
MLVTHDREVAARARRQITMRDGVVVSDSAAPGPVIPQQRNSGPGEQPGDDGGEAAR